MQKFKVNKFSANNRLPNIDSENNGRFRANGEAVTHGWMDYSRIACGDDEGHMVQV